jgi:hypothetical protein
MHDGYRGIDEYGRFPLMEFCGVWDKFKRHLQEQKKIAHLLGRRVKLCAQNYFRCWDSRKAKHFDKYKVKLY